MALKYHSATHNIVFIFEQQSLAFSEDSLSAKNMNVRPGGRRPVTYITVWNGQRQDMVDIEMGCQKG